MLEQPRHARLRQLVRSAARYSLLACVLPMGACTVDDADDDFTDVTDTDATDGTDVTDITDQPDAAVGDAGERPDSGRPDAAPPDAAPPDGGRPGTDAGQGRVDSGTGDAGLETGDAAVYRPDGGVVLRPAELPFSEEGFSRLQLPDDFEIEVYATPGGQTRMLAVHDGAVYVTRPMQGDVLRLSDDDGNGSADTLEVALSGWPTVHGILFVEGAVYLATPTQLIRASVADDGSFASPEVLLDDLPDGGQHPLRTLGLAPNGSIFVSVGSSCDACPETNPEHATILEVQPDGSSRSIFARGLRNTIGFGWHPQTQQLWGMDNGSDWRGNELPPEELNLIEEANDYGWPYCFGDEMPDPVISDPPGQTKAEYCAGTTGPVLTWQAHEAPIGLTFYDGTAFPAEYSGDAFAAMHGSWNRIPATGYSVVRIDFVDGVPVSINDFVSGFLAPDGLSTFGRPAGITTHTDGNLLFSDDTNGVIYRVTAQ